MFNAAEYAKHYYKANKPRLIRAAAIRAPEYVASQKTKGLCVRCTAAAAPGKSMCSQHLERHAATSRRHRHKRRLAGLCIRCGEQHPGPGYCAACKEIIRALPSRSAEGRRARTYNLHPEEIETIRLFQDNTCAICRAPGPQCIDHDHATGAVRGLLCNSCNLGLGHFEGNIAAAGEYLKLFSVGRV